MACRCRVHGDTMMWDVAVGVVVLMGILYGGVGGLDVADDGRSEGRR